RRTVRRVGGTTTTPARGARAPLLPRSSRGRGRDSAWLLAGHRQEQRVTGAEAAGGDASPQQPLQEHRAMTEIENDLRAWMQERAGRVHASPEILGADYRLHADRWRPRLAIGGGVAAVAGSVAAVLTLAGGASTAFAGWSAQPTTASPTQLQTANS